MLVEKLLKELQGHADSLRDTIADGGAADHAAYRSLVGERKGLLIAISAIREIARKEEENEDI